MCYSDLFYFFTYFSLLLELQGYFIKACEMYENVLVHTTTNKELQVIWLKYVLHYMYMDSE